MLVLVLNRCGMTNWYQLDWTIVVCTAFFFGVVWNHIYGTGDWIWKIGRQFWMLMEPQVCFKIVWRKCCKKRQIFLAKYWKTVFLKVENNMVFLVQRLSHSNHPQRSGTSATTGAKLLIPWGGRNCRSISESSIGKNFACGDLLNFKHTCAILHRGKCCGSCFGRLAMKLQINLMLMILQKCWHACSMVSLRLPWVGLGWPKHPGLWRSWSMLYLAWRSAGLAIIWALLQNFWNIRRMIFWTLCCT